MNGKIKFYDKNRGFGFIIPEEDADKDIYKDVFFHISGLEDRHGSYEPEEKVSFEAKESDRGWVAYDIAKVELQESGNNW